MIACKHDLSDLKPAPGAWVPDEYGELCAECVRTSCSAEETACRADQSCFETFRDCYPSKPTCGVRSTLHHDLASCISDRCRDECRLAETEFDCVGNYTWPQPDPTAPTRFQVEMSAFAGLPYVPVSVALCGGTVPECDETRAVLATTPGRYPLEYQWSAAAQLRPYLSVRGPSAQTLYVFEGPPLLNGHVLPITVVPELAYVAMLGAVGVVADEQHGTIAAIAVGCTADRLSAVSFRLRTNGSELAPPEAKEFYFRGMSPVAAPTVSATQEPNIGGFANVAPGVYTVEAWREGRVIGRMDSVLVVGGGLTQVNITPLTSDQTLP